MRSNPGANAAVSAVECAAQVDLFLTSLPHPSHVHALMAGTNGALAVMQPGSIWVDLTTNRKDLIIELAASAPPGVQVVDSPVTGAVDGARNGTLTLFISGDPEPVAKATDVVGEPRVGDCVRPSWLGQRREARNQPTLVHFGGGAGRGLRHGVGERR